MSYSESHHDTNNNNFDLIRLFAATQVAVTHAAEHLHVTSPWISILKLFPGVPIFFFVSGYLIFRSWANIKPPKIKVFATNRALRIYPGLSICLLLSLASVAASGYFTTTNVPIPILIGWLFAQLSCFQFFNPDFLRGYGVGVLNGSLWTIAVELQFYVLTPALYWVWVRCRVGTIAIFAALAILNAANTHLNHGTSLLEKLLDVSFLPWLALFFTGALASTSAQFVNSVLRIPGLLILAAYITSYQLSTLLGAGEGNGISAVPYAMLCCLIVKVAYTYPHLANSILRRNDISYGIYIYHMPVINWLLHAGYQAESVGIAVTLSATVVLATLSWLVVERPALRLKKTALRRT